MRFVRHVVCSLLAFLCILSIAEAADTQGLLKTIKSVGAKGEGHPAAHAAVKELSRAETAALMDILNASNDANPLAMNWLRGAFEAIAERTIEDGGRLPLDRLEMFVREESNAPRVRRLAYEWLAKVDKSAPDRIIPEMLADSSDEMRRDAVARVMKAAKKFQENGENEKAKTSYQEALTGAVDKDQVDEIVSSLDKLGEEINVAKHFGMLTTWRVIGPFDNRDKKGFDVAYPPEKELAFDAEYEGQLGPVSWKELVADSEDGLFDIGKLIENYKGSAMYVTTTYTYDREREVEFRLTTKNAWKLWVNGKLLFAREEYHRGITFDQYRVRGTLKPGENIILMKILQNEQDDSWAQDYHFKFRVTDFSGRAIYETPDRRAAQK